LFRNNFISCCSRFCIHGPIQITNTFSVSSSFVPFNLPSFVTTYLVRGGFCTRNRSSVNPWGLVCHYCLYEALPELQEICCETTKLKMHNSFLCFTSLIEKDYATHTYVQQLQEAL
jgi:hypothetical protein